MAAPQMRFCSGADGTQIAYFTLGEGPPLLHVSGWASDFEIMWEDADSRASEEQLAQGRLYITFDRRGSGASQRDVGDLSLEAHVADIAAVADHVGLEHFDMIGVADGACVTIAYAAEHPDRVSRLVLLSPYARGRDIVSPQAIKGLQELIRGNWSLARTAIADLVYPSGPSDRQRWFADFLRRSVSPETAARYVEFHATVDVTSYLPHVTAPALILHGRGDRNVPIRAGRDVAALMPDARFIALDGAAAVRLDAGASYAAVAEFLDQSREGATSQALAIASSTAIILFADIADSTALTERLGDAAFRDKARELDEALRRAISSNGGTAIEGKLLGDGVLATFGAAREAIACAGEMHRLAAGAEGGPDPRPLTPDPLLLHVGIHAGDVIRESNNVYGGAVNIASRISSEAAAGETLVSGTVRDLARTSAGVSFEDRGERELKGVGEPVRVFAVRSLAELPFPQREGAGG